MVEDRFNDEINFGLRMFKKYWKWFILLFAAVIVFAILVVFVFIMHVTQCPIGAQSTWNLGQWAIGTGIMFFLWLLLWEFLIVGLPALGVIGGGFAFFYMKVLSDEDEKKLTERREKEKEKRKKYRNWRVYGGGSGGATGIINIVFLIIVYTEGNWMTPFGAISYSYWVNTYLLSMFWIALIAGIPLLVLGLLILWKEVKDLPVETPKKVEKTPITE